MQRNWTGIKATMPEGAAQTAFSIGAVSLSPFSCQAPRSVSQSELSLQTTKQAHSYLILSHSLIFTRTWNASLPTFLLPVGIM